MLELSLDELWVDYFTLGGSLLPAEIQAFLAGEHPLGDHDHDLLVQALNERFLDHDGDHPLDYADELIDGHRPG
ncbi:MAG: hypothetical protein JOZ07_18860 [Solirubrobacterales bacterium]|nr:hypothetical protein [Solirubrobacterales bacterium]